MPELLGRPQEHPRAPKTPTAPSISPQNPHQALGSAGPGHGDEDDRLESQTRPRLLSTVPTFAHTGPLFPVSPQRTVDSGSREATGHDLHPRRSRSPGAERPRPSALAPAETFHFSQEYEAPLDGFIIPQAAPPTNITAPDPTQGRSLGVFGPESSIRLRLRELLINPWFEPAIFILIILHTILLAVQAASDVWSEGSARPDRWGETPIDWAIFGILAIFTLEVTAKIIVSQLIINPADYSTYNDRKRGIRRASARDILRTIFRLGRHNAVETAHGGDYELLLFPRSPTLIQDQSIPVSVKYQQLLQLERRAFLSHSLNRLDFIAVLSFWISFALGITGVESTYHIYVFRTLSCLRILRLMVFTRSAAVRLCPACHLSIHIHPRC